MDASCPVNLDFYPLADLNSFVARTLIDNSRGIRAGKGTSTLPGFLTESAPITPLAAEHDACIPFYGRDTPLATGIQS